MAQTDMQPSFDDTADFADADRGFIAALEPCVIKNARGQVVWNNDDYDFVYKSQPHQRGEPTVNPKLWRQAQLLAKQGLYRISETIYQVRGFDISHITFVEGDTGIIVIDPLISCECAAAALELYRSKRPGAANRLVKAVIYTHSHIDHFGGAAGVLTPATTGISAASVPIIAPEFFLEEATAENIFAGPIMRQRASFMYGTQLPKSPLGQVGVGLGMGTSRGTTSLIPPTVDITHTAQTLTIDGVKLVFQMVPNTEAPAELNIYFPQQKALLIAECATHALHNIITLRGAVVRDAKAWSRYLDETLMLYCEGQGEGGKAEVEFGSHGWPTWGNERIKTFLEQQRDLYAYIHDQTVRQMNQGWNGTEIAEQLVLPPALSRSWHTQGFYGSVSHNVKGIYQRYMTWFDGSAENLWKWPPREEGIRYVACMGGVEQVLKKADDYINQGDLRFAATLLGHVVAAANSSSSNNNQGNTEKADSSALQNQARERLSHVFEKLGFQTENATWRNFYLSQSKELRKGPGACIRPGLGGTSPASGMAGFAPNLSVEQWLGTLSIRIDGVEAGKEEQTIRVDLKITAPPPTSAAAAAAAADADDDYTIWTLILSNGALTYRSRRPGSTAAATAAAGGSGSASPGSLSLTKAELGQLLNGGGVMKAIEDEQALNSLNKILSLATITIKKNSNRL